MYQNDDEIQANKGSIGDTIKGKLQGCARSMGECLDRQCESNYQLFALMIGAGLVLFFLSLMFLPVVLISPSKFSMCLCLGSMFIVFSFFCIKKPSDYIASLCSGSRMYVTMCYFGSVCLTFFACIIAKSYLLALPASIIQLISSLWIICSFFPGGSAGMSLFTKCIGNCLKSTVEKVLS